MADSDIVVKKKRGRKPKPKNEEVEVKIPKKRGRKPKIKIISEEEKNKYTLPSKRGRKPKDKFLNVNKELTFDIITNNILHLPINIDELDEYDTLNNLIYNPDITNPEPYDPLLLYDNINKANEPLSTHSFLNGKGKNEDKDKNKHSNTVSTPLKHENILEDDYINQIKLYNVDMQKQVSCYWCSYNCDETYRIPYNIINNEFEMYGNFCSPECACAFNFKELDDEYIWERYSLINYLYGKGENIKIAPNKLVLNCYGGPLSVDEYKSVINNNYSIKVVLPPHKIMTPQLEIKKKTDSNNVYIPLNINRVKRYTEKLKLCKGNENKSNTLENCMNLIYN